MFRFVDSGSDGLPPKRKAIRKACEKCRKKKKRCLHQASSGPPPANINSLPGQRPSLIADDPSQQLRSTTTVDDSGRSPIENSIALTSHNLGVINSPEFTGTRDHSSLIEHDDEDENSRFVGELNPEATLVAAVSPGSATAAAVVASARSAEDVVGIWIPRKLVNAAKSSPVPILPVLLPHLQSELSYALPSRQTYDSLYKLYVETSHPIFPIVNLEAYQRQRGQSKDLLKLAVCLCVASNPKATSLLQHPTKIFASRTVQLIRSAVDHGLVREKQMIIQLLVILALSTQLSDDRHASAEFACRAVSYVHTLGLHHDTLASRKGSLYNTRLFCCVFALDRINAAIQGRPVLIHERDLGRDVQTCINEQKGPFRLLLQVILHLDKVIALYRPRQIRNGDRHRGDEDVGADLPTFEDLLGSCGTLRGPAALVATIETLYHAAVVLSCRSRSLDEANRNSTSHSRQILSASCIISIVGSEYQGQLSILPFVPYAVSLALRVYYRDLRLSKSAFTRARAQRQLLQACNLLRDFGDGFSSLLTMVEFAEQIVREIDRVHCTKAGRRRTSIDSPSQSATQNASRAARQSETAGEKAAEETVSTHVPYSVSQDFDITDFDFDFDLDVFDHFDPGLDIHIMDVALGGEIGPSLPPTFEDPSSPGT